MKSVKRSKRRKLTRQRNNAATLIEVDVVIERLIMRTHQQWFSTDARSAKTAKRHRFRDAKVAKTVLVPTGTFPIFSDYGHQGFEHQPAPLPDATVARESFSAAQETLQPSA